MRFMIPWSPSADSEMKNSFSKSSCSGGFAGGPVVGTLPCKAGDTGSIPLVWEDPACFGATKPMRHNYWAQELQLLQPVCLESKLRSGGGHCNEKPAYRSEEWPHSPLEKAHKSSNKDPPQPKHKSFLNILKKSSCSKLVRKWPV